jgi:iron complex outermembrane receptor protein
LFPSFFEWNDMSRTVLFDALSGKSLGLCLAPCILVSLPLQAAEEEVTLELPATAISDTEISSPADLSATTNAGSRLGLSPLQTPASTSSIRLQEIQQRNAATVQQALTRSPGITFIGTPGNGGTAVSARGFTGHSATMQLYDGNRLYVGAGSVTFPIDSWSVEQIDVLRGPASVLYGEGATGAVINVLPKKPFAGELRSHVRLGYGTDERRQSALDSGGSLSDSLSYRVTLNRQASNGWVDRGASASLALGAALRWEANEELRFLLSHDHAEQEPQAYFGTPLVEGHYRKSLRDNNYNVKDATVHYRDQSTRLATDWIISETLSANNQLYFLKTQRRWRNAEAYSWQPNGTLQRSDFLNIKHTQEQIGERQTFNVQHSLFGLASQTLLGADYNSIRFRRKHDFDNSYQDSIPLTQSGAGHYQSTDSYGSRDANRLHQFALFAENRTQLTERLALVSGLRRDQVHLERDDLQADTRNERTLAGDNWRAGLVFAVSTRLSLYAQFATSTEGVSNLLTLSPSQQQWDLSKARQTELGLKQQFLQDTAQWTLAAYRIVKKKLLSADPLDPTTALQVGQQSADGIETSVELRLPYSMQLSANASWVRAEYDEFSSAGNDYRGKQPINVPRRSANLWLSKDVAEQFNLAAGARYVDSRYADNANSVKVPGYTVVDANLAWRLQSDLSIGLQLNNLCNRQYATSAANNGRQWYLGEPRALFVTADYLF